MLGILTAMLFEVLKMHQQISRCLLSADDMLQKDFSLLIHSYRIENNVFFCRSPSEYLQGFQQPGMTVLVRACQGSYCREPLQKVPHKPTPTLRVLLCVLRLFASSAWHHESSALCFLCVSAPTLVASSLSSFRLICAR